VIQIDIGADLSMVDDEDRNFARLPADTARIKVGAVAVAGRPGFWSWVQIDEIEDTIVFFHQINAREAAAHGELAVPATA
jgi:hypothetical protein